MEIAYEVMFTAKDYVPELRTCGFKKFSLTACSYHSVYNDGTGFVPHGLGYLSGIEESDGIITKRVPLQLIEFDKGKDLFEESLYEMGFDGEDFSLWTHSENKGHASIRSSRMASFKSNPLLFYTARALVYGLFKKNSFMSSEVAINVKKPELRKRFSAIPHHMTDFQFSRFNDDANPVSTLICSDILKVLLEENDELSFIWATVGG